jgi:hypothetical protein
VETVIFQTDFILDPVEQLEGYQIDLVRGVAFCLGYKNFAYINEYKLNLYFYNVLGRLVMQCFISI